MENQAKPPKTMAEYYEQLARFARAREPQIKAEQKKTEQEFRKACEKDTAGTLLNLSMFTKTQFDAIQSQLDTIYPVGALARTVDAVVAKITEIDRRLSVLEQELAK